MNELSIGSILEKLPFPVEGLYGRYLHFLTDVNGDILHFYNGNASWKNTFMADSLIEYANREKNIFRAFNLPIEPSFFKKERKVSLQIRPPIVVTHTWRFLTDLPTTHLTLVKADSLHLLGILSPSRILPEDIHMPGSYIVFLDDEDNLRGIDTRILPFLKISSNPADSILGTPASQYFSPTPAQFQTAYFKGRAIDDRGWRTKWVLDPAAAGQIQTDPSITWDVNHCIFHWATLKKSSVSITLPSVLNFQESDIRYTVEFELLEGDAPVLTIGTPGGDLESPSYLAGENHGTAERYVLKKEGLVLKIGSFPRERLGRIHFTFLKIGRAFIFLVNDREMLRYFDPDFPSYREARCLLGLRSQSRVIIHGIKIEERAAVAEPDLEQITRTGSSMEPRFFSVMRMENIGLSMYAPQVAAYLFTDITALRTKANRLEQQYRNESKRSRNLAIKLQEVARVEKELVGQNPLLLRIKEQARMLAGRTATLLIQGATGTGKEMLAHYIHVNGSRSDKPFVKVDCSTIPESLMESELFGHEKGAFTGAVERKTGRFEQADGGTLFLDEIGNLNLTTQAKLLGFLQDRVITRIGGMASNPLDIQIIAAVNSPLETLVQSNRFRPDLYFRLSGIVFNLPLLKERLEDIPILANRFLDKFNALYGKRITAISQDAMETLLAHDWPGNIRELENVVNRAYLFCDGERIEKAHLSVSRVTAFKANSAKTGIHIKGLTPETLIHLLKKHKGHVAEVSRALGISRESCYSNMRKHGITPIAYRFTVADPNVKS